MLCPHCGKQINDNDTFCAFCGATISGADNPAPPAQPSGSGKKFIVPIICIVCTVAVIGAGAFILPDIINSRKNTPPKNPENLGGHIFTTTSADIETIPPTEAETIPITEAETIPTTEPAEDNKLYEEAIRACIHR